MSPDRPDPLPLEAGASYTKGEVNRAGRLLRRYLEAGVASDFDEALATIGIQEVAGAFRAVTWWRSLHARPLTLVAAGLRCHVDEEHGGIDGHIDVTQRLKRRSTVIDKLTREPMMEVAQMHDIGGVRARLPTTGHLYAVSRRLRETWTIIRVRDYIAEPKSSGYRGLHVIVRREGYPIEVQLRSVLQDAWANQVEEDGRTIGVGLKFGAGEADVHEYYRAVSEAFALMDRGELLPEELVTAMNARRSIIKDILPQNEDRQRHSAPQRVGEISMRPADIKHFLVIYNVKAGDAEVRPFGTDNDAAQLAYEEVEQEIGDRSDFDVVLLSSDSLQTIKRTHSSYFDTRESFEALLPAGVLRE